MFNPFLRNQSLYKRTNQVLQRCFAVKVGDKMPSSLVALVKYENN